MLAAIAAAILATVGIVITLLNRSWAERNSDGFAAFASGLLVATAVLHLMPESVERSDFGPWLILTGYMVLFFTGLIFGIRKRDDKNAPLPVAAPLIGIGFHSFVDGLEYPILFEYDVFAGFMAVSGLVLHEVAEGVIVFGLLARANMSKALAVFIALIASAFTTPLGTLFSLQFVDSFDEQMLGMMTSLAAGALLFVGASYLPQRIANRGRTSLWLFFVLGVAIAGMLTLTHSLEGGHVHEHHDH